MKPSNPLAITDVVLRDAHQSLLATRLRIEDMLPIAPKLDEVGYWSIESWGGATFDACIRYLGEDPWERLRLLKAAMPKTPQQMLLRGQNLLGYRHYADDLVETFVERAALNGIDVFRIFDAMNDVRNLETSVKAALATGKHAQGTMSYTVSPVHDLEYWVDMGRRLEDMGCHSICIKDMAGLLKPYVAETLVTRLKETCSVPIAMQSHATTGMSTGTILKAAEAGIDMVDTAISSMSMTYGHSPTESVVAILEDTDRSTGLNLPLLEEIASYFREVRKKYAKFEGALKGVDSRILVAQVPGGMLTNMENQLREQGATDRLDAVLIEIPKVREELGFLPLVTPTSQIVGSQAVLNVLMGERYKSITNETAGVLKGEYGATPAPVNVELQQRVLAEGEAPITCRPADNLTPELDVLTAELQRLAEERSLTLASDVVDDVLTYALFPQVGLKFLENRNNPGFFEPPPWDEPVRPGLVESAAAPVAVPPVAERYRVEVDGRNYHVVVSPEGAVAVEPQAAVASATSSPPAAGRDVPAPLAGTVVAVKVKPGQVIASGELIMLLEAMKMETEVRSPQGGTVLAISVKEGDSLQVGQTLLTLG
ncbi:sodium-extruding oxaloacetate decarboxylase subunit alpha [Thiocapsa marina]|uniref:Oxaloacetate decarboxylase alpha subunit n=1 Tax=Thiocapsa marina 5811 TaxID=768671 RepID=F9UFT5_9GAMM|nr:sodium-extruding oxaloacetate decarboxylase subunit alpha [Thiocapsa marina]EGV16959.1 oxaloacetate decarboxylase alpha subunit [Thiocapsa marina 5811]